MPGWPGAARHLVTLLVPGLFECLGIGLDPGLGCGDELIDAADQLVDQTDLPGLGGEAGALAQHGHERVLNTEHAHSAGDAATAGQQAQRNLGQAKDTALDVSRDPVVGGQRDLQAATEGGAVDGGDDGPTERLGVRSAFLTVSTVLKASPAFSGPRWIIDLRSPPAKKVSSRW